MKIKCVRNELLRGEEFGLNSNNFSDLVHYGELDIGDEYLVMGMILKEGNLFYLIDSGIVVAACPQILFEITDYSIPINWYFKHFTKDYYNYINMQAVWGYYELCFIDAHYEELVSMEESAHRIYFKRKAIQLSENE